MIAAVRRWLAEAKETLPPLAETWGLLAALLEKNCPELGHMIGSRGPCVTKSDEDDLADVLNALDFSFQLNSMLRQSME